MIKKKFPLTIVFVVLIISMACTINVGGPVYPDSPIAVSTEALTSLKEQIQEAVDASAQTGQVTLYFTESQLTSFMVSKLDSQDNPFLTQPQAYLQNGQIQIYGTVIKGFLNATVRIIMTASIDNEGKLLLELTSADFGPFPVPDSLKEMVTSLVTEVYTGSLGPVATGYNLESIVIANGAMLIFGRIK